MFGHCRSENSTRNAAVFLLAGVQQMRRGKSWTSTCCLDDYFILFCLCVIVKSVDVFNSLYFYKYNIKNVWTYVVLKMAFHVSVFNVF